MSTTKESIEKEKQPCQSPKPVSRPLSPLTIGVINTITWKAPVKAKPKPSIELPKIDLDFTQASAPPEGYSYNSIESDSNKAKIKK